jgi:hypothetical protein
VAGVASSGVKAVLLTDKGPVVVETLEELAKVLSELQGRAYILLIEGRVVGAVEARLSGAEQRAGASRSMAEGPSEGRETRRAEAGGRSQVAAVFDQMFRGFAEIVAREVPGVELHEVVGRGLEKPVRVGRIYKEPARDDFDVLSLVERLAAGGKRVVFFTGDKKLANQAAALGDERIIVMYMPPNEYPGKESLAKAMIEAVRKAVAQS